jgi:hypothetical protein
MNNFRGVRWRLALEAATVLFTGAISIIFGSGYLIQTLAARINGEWTHEYSHRIPADVVWLAGFPYDFRLYSAGLLASVMLVQGTNCLLSLGGLTRDDGKARSAALRASAYLAAITVPLLPWMHLVRPVTAAAILACVATLIGTRKPRPKCRFGRLVATASSGR